MPVIAIVPFMAWQRRLPELLLWGWVAVLTAVLVAAPWALAIHSQEPDYWSYFFWEEHIKRFSADNAQHKAPFWYFVPVFFAGAMPWTLALPTALRGLRQQSPEMKTCAAYLFCWIIFPFLFFSIAKGKLGTYILPCFAPLAALLALGLTTNVGESRLSLRFAAWVNVLFAGLLAAVVTVFLTFGFKFEQVLSENEWYKSIVLTIALLIWAVLAWRARNRYGRAQEVRISAVVAFALIPAAFMLTLPLAAPGSASFSQTPEVFIADNADRINDDTLLLSDDVGLAAALAWQFSRSGVILYNSRGELSYGLSYPDASGRHVERDSFGQWLQRQRKRHAVALFLRLKRDRAPESLPAADFDVTQGRFRLVVYQRQP